MSKIFVLRVKSLLSSVDSTLRFDSDNEVVIPLAVFDQLQNYQGKPEKAKIAEAILDYWESFDAEALFGKGVKQSNGSILRIAKNYHETEVKLDGISETDRRVFQVCQGLKNENPNKKVILVSKSKGIRLKARSIGIEAEDFKDDLFPLPQDQYSGRKKILVPTAMIDKFYSQKELKITDISQADRITWITNMFLEMKSIDSNSSALARYDGEKIVPLVFNDDIYPYGITAKNAGQRILMECLLRDWSDAPLVIAKGGAGTGKTFCSLAFALSMLDRANGHRILVATPSETVGNERLGYLPGDVRDKISPYLGGIKDNLSILLNSGKNKDKKDSKELHEQGEYYFERGLIEVQPIGFLRGRTIVNSTFIIDETQNIEPGDIKSIVTRAAEGSKFIFLGDPTQVDNPKLNERYNGLVYLSEKMKGNPLCWQVTLSNSESVRSELSTIASVIL